MKKISSVLWSAANEHLVANAHEEALSGKRGFSCDAIHYALSGAEHLLRPTFAFIRGLGCNVNGLHEFDEFEFGAGLQRFNAHAQGARYLWLMFAYRVAKDEGL